MYINEICSTVQTDNNWYDAFPLPNGLKKKRRFTDIALQLGFGTYRLE
jgi:hypothetical protein